MDTHPSLTQFSFTQQQLLLVGKHTLCKCPRWRWKVWPLAVFIVFVMMWLCRRRAVRLRSSMVEDMAQGHAFFAVPAEQREFFYSFLLCRLSTAGLQRRTVWSYLPRAVTSWSDMEWKPNFRVSRATFRFLCRELRLFLEWHSSVRTHLWSRVTVCLTRLGSNNELRIISNLCGVGISTCVALRAVLLLTTLQQSTLIFLQDKVSEGLLMVSYPSGTFLSVLVQSTARTSPSLIQQRT